MKLTNLFEASVPEIVDTKNNILIEYMIKTEILCGNMFPEYKNIKALALANSGKFPWITAVYQECATRAEARDAINDLRGGFKVIGNKIELTGDIVDHAINFYFDKIGPPPFKLGKLGLEVLMVGKKFNSLEWLPEECETLYIEKCGLKSISGIDKFLKKCEYLEISNSSKLQGGVLSVFKIPNLTTVNFYDWNQWIATSKQMNTLSEILTHHLSGDRDIFDCQEELVEAGLEEFAKL